MRKNTLIVLIIFSAFMIAQNKKNDERKQQQLKDTFEKFNNTHMVSINGTTLIVNNRFTGKIEIVNENTIKYDDEVLIIDTPDKKHRIIFEKGIFYPGLITGIFKKGQERKDELNSTLIRNDSLTIVDFKEQRNYFKSPKERRFKFLLFFKGFANPTEYVIVLTNKNIEIDTDIETFLNGAILTEIEKGSILI